MSVVAWDGKTLAADRLATVGDRKLTVCKAKKINGDLVGCAGNMAATIMFMNWYETGKDILKWPSCMRDKDGGCGVLVVRPDGHIFKYEEEPIPFEILDHITAIGSGSECALGAMLAGADAKKAVELTALVIAGVGHGVDVLTLEVD